MHNIADIRREYKKETLDESNVSSDAMQQFGAWWQEALNSNIDEVNAMTLATSKEGRPSARIVLLKGYTEEGFLFFTNYESKKGKDIESNPKAALVFFWKELERQVRIEGTVKKTGAKESEEYFLSRPTGSQAGAWASPQSRVIKNREELETRLHQIETKYRADSIPRPEFWGGYIVIPNVIEFWQGRPNRLHDRIQYTRTGDNWKIERLAP